MAIDQPKNAPSPYWRVKKWIVWLPAYMYGFIFVECVIMSGLFVIAWQIRSGFAALSTIDPHVAEFVQFLMYLVVCCMALVGALIQVGVVMAWKIWRDTDEGNESLKRAARAQDDMNHKAEAAYAAMAAEISASLARVAEQARMAVDTRASVERMVQGLEPKVLAVVEREMRELPRDVLAGVKDNVAVLIRPIVEEKLAELVERAIVEKQVRTYLESVGFIRTIATAVIQEAKRQHRDTSGGAGPKGGIHGR